MLVQLPINSNAYVCLCQTDIRHMAATLEVLEALALALKPAENVLGLGLEPFLNLICKVPL